jgi:hypothetical protein
MSNSTNPPVPQSLAQINKQTIKALKLRIKAAGTTAVRKRLGFTEQNLSYHLNPKDFSKVNIPTLERITTVVVELEKEKLERAQKLNSKAIQSITQ